MEDILPDHRDRKPGRTIYDIVADLKKQRSKPQVQTENTQKKLLPHQIFKIKLEEAKKTLPKSELKWKRLEVSDESENESEMESDSDSESEKNSDVDSASEPENDNKDFDEWNFYWNLYKDSDNESDTEIDLDTENASKEEVPADTKEQLFYDNFIQTSDDPWEALKEEEAAIEKYLLHK